MRNPESPGRRRTLPAVALAAATILAVAPPARAIWPFDSEPFEVLDVDCTGLKLKGAHGVPASKQRSYKFTGTCKLTSGYAFPAVLADEWDGDKKELRESFKILGSFNPGKPINKTIQGTVKSIYRCNGDPIIFDPLFAVQGVACTGVAHKNETGLDLLSNAYWKSRPIARGKTRYAEAVKLSSSTQAGLAGTTFKNPLFEGRRVDYCYLWGKDCGAPAANAFCKQRGFAKASAFDVEQDIGAKTPTMTLGDGKVCAQAPCDGFLSITCVK